MLVFDLRWLLFLVLAGLMVALWAAYRLGRSARARTSLRGWAEAAQLEGAPFGLVLLDGEQACRYANAYARSLLGLPQSGRLPPAAWTQALADDLAALHRQHAAGRYRSISLPGEGGATDRYALWWLAPLGAFNALFLLDVTARRQSEQAARALLNDLSHELRTPLATLLTHLEVLSLPSISQETGRQSLALLKAEAQRMARLVHQMLELGRLETAGELELRPVDLLRLVEDVVAQVSPRAAERQVALSIEAATPLPACHGDEDRLRQVFLNLLDNAIKYVRPGDRVVVALARAEGGVRCAVRDSGPGIPAAHVAHLTRRFYRAAPPEVEGTGLGLALVEEILRHHGSHLEITSRTEGDETGTEAAFVLRTA